MFPRFSTNCQTVPRVSIKKLTSRQARNRAMHIFGIFRNSELISRWLWKRKYETSRRVTKVYSELHDVSSRFLRTRLCAAFRLAIHCCHAKRESGQRTLLNEELYALLRTGVDSLRVGAGQRKAVVNKRLSSRN
jgi:hypothetical protein